MGYNNIIIESSTTQKKGALAALLRADWLLLTPHAKAETRFCIRTETGWSITGYENEVSNNMLKTIIKTYRSKPAYCIVAGSDFPACIGGIPNKALDINAKVCELTFSGKSVYIHKKNKNKTTQKTIKQSKEVVDCPPASSAGGEMKVIYWNGCSYVADAVRSAVREECSISVDIGKFEKPEDKIKRLEGQLAKTTREICDLKQQIKELQETIKKLEDDFE